MRDMNKEIELKEVSKKEAWQNLLPQVSIDGAIVYNAKVGSMKMSMGGQTGEIKMGKDDTNTWNAGLQVAIPLYAPGVYKAMSLTKSDMELAVEKINAIDIETLNQAIRDFSDVVEPLAKFFNIFDR